MSIFHWSPATAGTVQGKAKLGNVEKQINAYYIDEIGNQNQSQASLLPPKNCDKYLCSAFSSKYSNYIGYISTLFKHFGCVAYLTKCL